jgi:hypothetical protein
VDEHGHADPDFGPVPVPAASAATAALVVALVGLPFCPAISGVGALVVAARGEQMIEEAGGALGGTRRVRAARIIGTVSIVWGLLVLVVTLVAVSDGL